MNHLVLRHGEASELQREKYQKFYQRGLTPTRYVNTDCLHDFGLTNNMRGLLNKAGLSFGSTIGLPTYESLNLEFLRSYIYITPNNADDNLIGAVTYRVFNREYTLNQDVVSEMLHFPRGNNVQYCIPSELDWNRMAYELWERISGEHNVIPEARYLSHIHNPNIRYLHHTLATNIFRSTNNNKVNIK